MPTNRLLLKEQIATYANTMFDTAMQNGGEDVVLRICLQLRSMVEIVRSHVDLNSALKDPGYNNEQKAQIVEAVFKDYDPILVKTFIVMVERSEIDLLGRVANLFEEMMTEKLNIVILEVETAVELDDALRTKIKDKVESELGKRVVLNERVNKSLLGGVILSTKNERLDASLLLQVEKTREVLKA